MEKLQVDNGHLQAVILQVARETGSGYKVQTGSLYKVNCSKVPVPFKFPIILKALLFIIGLEGQSFWSDSVYKDKNVKSYFFVNFHCFYFQEKAL